MDRTPSPRRIFWRGVAWAPLLGGILGALVWGVVCSVTFSWPALIFVAFAVPVGAVLGVVPGVVGAGVVAHVARHAALRPGDAAAVTAAACGGVVTDLAALGLLTGGGSVVLVWGAVGTVLAAGTGAVGGLLATAPLPPTTVSARRNGAAAATGTTSPGWSPAPGR